MKVVTWNVNGIRARHAQVLELIEQQRPDVLCLQELKATPEQVPESLAARAASSCVVLSQHGTSDHAPVVATFEGI